MLLSILHNKAAIKLSWRVFLIVIRRIDANCLAIRTISLCAGIMMACLGIRNTPFGEYVYYFR